LLVAILLMGVLAVAYTVLGGLAAVIWTDVVQFIVLVGGAAWLAVTLVAHVPDGAAGIVRDAAEAGRLDVFDWTDMSKLTFLSAMIGWFFVFLNDYGTDQVTVQRLMAVRTDAGVVKAIAFNAVNDLVINGMLIFIGIGMLAYFRAYPQRLGTDAAGDGILPYYIMHILPAGVSGLMVTAIFAAAMSSVDSGINSLTTVIVRDWIVPLRGAVTRPGGDVALARWLTVGLGVLATAAAVYAAGIGNIVRMWMNVMGLFAAPVLSVFILGVLTRRAHLHGWLAGACCAIGLTVLLQRLYGDRLMAMWHFPISFAVSTAVGYFASLILKGPRRSGA